ncbi:MAG: hypothetical protein EBU31_18400, partial [Proteobacteria bacterium]|nr:hypothetical protein [Pseudomonadota bacterium]
TTVFTPINPFLALESLLMPSTYAAPTIEQPGWVVSAWMLHPARTYCLLTLAMSLALMVASAFSVRALGARTVSTPWWRRMTQAAKAEGRTAMRVGHNPIAWRESQLRGTSLMALVGRWGFVVVGILGGIMLPILHRTGALTLDGFRTALQTVVAAESVVIVLTALNMSATAVSREREDGSLDIILTTPIQPGPYIAGKLRGIIQFLAPMLAVPAATLLASAVYVLAKGMGAPGGITVQAASGTATVAVPAMLPEGALEYPLVMLAFTAFAVMVGLQWSIKSKGTIGSAVGAVFATGVTGLVLGLCGMAAGRSIPGVGAFMNALTPVNLLAAVITPEAVADDTLQQGLGTFRVALAIG